MKKPILKTTSLIISAVYAVSSIVLAAPVSSRLPNDLWEYSEVWDESDNLTCEFKEISVTLPADWENKYNVITNERSVSFYHTASRNGWTHQLNNGMESGGHLFTIALYQNYDFYNLPDFEIVGSGEYGIYVSLLPTDVQGYYYDEEVWNEWTALADDLEKIRDSVTVTSSGEGIVNSENLTFQNSENTFDKSSFDSPVQTSEYILENSSTSYLITDDLAGMNADEIQMAINEIYARHHRKFVTKSIQKYFNSKSWYKGTVDASKFNESSLNQYEVRNIALMLQCMNDLPDATATVTESNSVSGSAFTAVSGSVLYATATVNIRSYASVNGVIMGIIPQGYSAIAVGSPDNGWVPVNYNGIRGYVSQDYLSVSGSAINSSIASSTDISAPEISDAQSEHVFTDASAASVTAAVQLYAGSYRDNTVFIPENGWNDYYSLVISNITDNSFDFTIYLMDYSDSIKETMFATNTAVFTGNGTTAFYDGKQYDLTFTFPDYHNALPDVTDIQISGFWAVDGITFSNNGVPGHEFC